MQPLDWQDPHVHFLMDAVVRKKASCIQYQEHVFHPAQDPAVQQDMVAIICPISLTQQLPQIQIKQPPPCTCSPHPAPTPNMVAWSALIVGVTLGGATAITDGLAQRNAKRSLLSVEPQQVGIATRITCL